MNANKTSSLLTMMPLFLVILIDSMGVSLLYPILEALIIHPGSHFIASGMTSHSREIIYGLVIGIFMLAWFFGATMLGDLSDMIGRRKALIIALTGTFIGYLVAAIAIDINSIWLLLLGRIIAGFTAGAQPIAQAAIIDYSTEKTQSKNMAFILLAMMLGYVLGPMISGTLSNNTLYSGFNYRTPLYFVASISLINIALLLSLFKETITTTKRVTISFSRPFTLFSSAFTDKKLRLIAIALLILNFGWISYSAYLGEYLDKTYHYDTFMVALFLTALGVGYALGASVLVTQVNKIMKLKPSVIFGFLMAGIALVLPLIFPYIVVIWVSAIIAAAFVVMAWSNLLVILSNQVSKTEQGMVMGVATSIRAISEAAGLLVMGSIIQFGLDLPFYFVAISLLIVALIISLYRLARPI